MSELTYRELPDIFYRDVLPERFPDVRLLALNTGLASELGLDPVWLATGEGTAFLSGQFAKDGGAIAMAYGGHQFGHWAGQLGDGRARLIAEHSGRDDILRELHLKGAGPTPFSRRGDGKASLGSAVREYLVSEAMHYLGVETTRALSIVTTGEQIVRERMETGAVFCRTAKSHIRVGTFQYASQSSGDDVDAVKALADFAIERLYPGAPLSGPERYRYFLRAVIKAQADLVARWMGFGFIHGVMNTDNMCVSGETIDYGPCAFMDDFHPGKTFSSIDRRGRYAWNRQPAMAHWNLAQLAQTLMPLFGDSPEVHQEVAEADLNGFIGDFQAAFGRVMRAKFGLTEGGNIDEFMAESVKAMTLGEVDYTLFFRRLTDIASGMDDADFLALFADADIGIAWLKTWKAATDFNGQLLPPQQEAMRAVNPVIIPRNHRITEAIAAAEAGDMSVFERLLKAFKTPFDDRPEYADLQLPPQPTEVVTQTFCGT